MGGDGGGDKNALEKRTFLMRRTIVEEDAALSTCGNMLGM